MSKDNKDASAPEDADKTGCNKKDPHRHISTTSHFIPFGAFNTDSSAREPANEVYVGHENERAQFIRRLLNSGRSGAYLITGHRGTGKTSFVNYCLDEYERNTFQRFLRTSVGKSFWDIILVLFGGFLLIALPGLLTEIYVYSSHHKVISFVFTLPLIVVVYRLIIYAYDQLLIFATNWSVHRKNVSQDDLMKAIIFIMPFIIAICILFSILNDSSMLVSWLFWFFGYYYFLCSLFNCVLSKLPDLKNLNTTRSKNLCWFGILHLPAVILIWVHNQNPLIKFPGTSGEFEIITADLFSAALVLISIGLLLQRGVNVRKNDQIKEHINILTEQTTTELNRESRAKVLTEAFMTSQLFYILAFFICAVFVAYVQVFLVNRQSGLTDFSFIIGGGLTWVTFSSIWTNEYRNNGLLRFLNIFGGVNLAIFLLGFNNSVQLVLLLIFLIVVGFSFKNLVIASSNKANTSEDVQSASTKMLNLGDTFLFTRENLLTVLKATLFVVMVCGYILPVIAHFFTAEVESSQCTHARVHLAKLSKNDKNSLVQSTSKEDDFTDLTGLKLSSYCKLIGSNEGSLTLQWQEPLELKGDGDNSNGLSKNQNSDESKNYRNRFDASFLFIEPPSHHWYWLIALLFTFVVFLEYEWLIRPSRLVIEEPSLRRKILNEFNEVPSYFFQAYPVNAENKENYVRLSRLKRRYKKLAESTLVNQIFLFWIPVIRLKVNLGFDDIKHSMVILTVLKDLRDSYHEKFVSLKSSRVQFLYMVWICVFMFATSHLSSLILDITLADAGNRTIYVAKKKIEDEEKSKKSQDAQDCPTIKKLLNCQSNGQGEVRGTKPDNNEKNSDFVKDTAATQINNPIKIDEKNRIYITKPLFTYLFGIEMYVNKTENVSDGSISRIKFVDTTEIIVERQLIFYLLHMPLLEIDRTHWHGEENFVSDLLFQGSIFPFKDYSHLNNDKLAESYAFRVYHLIIFLLLYLVGRFINARVGLFPYKENETKIIESISAVTSTNIDDTAPLLTSRLPAMNLTFGARKQVVTFPLDSRTVEQQFLHILKTIGSDSVDLNRNHYHMPTPDITIIFDELDKLGTRYDPEEPENDPKTRDSLKSTEIKRSLKIRSLLSDFKHIITSDNSRFIFIGGRHLSDEWFADQSQKDQLLPSIFDKEIYLQSLLTDTKDHTKPIGPHYMLNKIKQYVVQQKFRAEHTYKELMSKKEASVLMAHLFWRHRNTFSPSELAQIDAETYFSKVDFALLDVMGDVEGHAFSSDQTKYTFINQLAQFLAYRSHGIPKRLNEVFSSLIVPVGRVVEHDQDESCDLSKRRLPIMAACNDVLHFSDIVILRIQLISRTYNRIESAMGRLLHNRDDKLVTSIFYLSDFLFKFHQRAFAWDSLEKIDDLADINRAPDLRKMLGVLVDSCAELLFHRVLNGMYVFRFKSNIAREIMYISRQSPIDEAAFNFTKDESQTLKELYVRKLKDGKVGNPELIAALGELYEFDQDYETARKEYHRAIDAFDEKLEKLAGGFSAPSNKSPTNIPYIFTGQSNSLARQAASWAISRLRLNLQIGMTYELTRDFEKAEMIYHESHLYARSLLNAYLSVSKNRAEFNHQSDKLALFFVKHFNLLYQPVFAKAWAAEKDASAVDTSVALIEDELNYLERVLPFRLRKDIENVYDDVSPTKIQNANIGLLKAELHDKAGDLLFFKGCQIPKLTDSDPYNVTKYKSEWAGYLIHADFHYVISLHYLRHYNLYRRYASKGKYNQIFKEVTFGEQLPDFPLMSISSTLSDLAESILPRVHVPELFSDFEERFEGQINPRTINEATKELHDNISDIVNVTRDWLVKKSEYFEPKNIPEDKKESKYYCKRFIKDWFGVVVSIGKNSSQYHPVGPYVEAKPEKLIDICGERHSSALDKLLCYFSFNHLSAFYLRDSGYIEDGVNELIRGADTINFMLEKIYFDLEHCKYKKSYHKILITFLIQRALFRLESAYILFVRQLEQQEPLSIEEGKQHRFVEEVPPKLIVTLITLYIQALRFGEFYLPVLSKSYLPHQEQADEAKKMFRVMVGLAKYLGVGEDTRENIVSLFDSTINPPKGINAIIRTLDELLTKYLHVYRYPILNRLNGLKTLVFSALQRNDIEKASALASELVETSEKYRSPFHFMAINIASVSYQIAKAMESRDEKGDSAQKLKHESEKRHWYRLALKYTLQSQQMYTQRSSYYDSIVDLYYLYDDFNDRHIHHGHAIQMFWASTSETISTVSRKELNDL